MKILKSILLQIVYFGMGIIAGSLLFYWTMEYQHSRMKLVEIPDVVGMNSEKAWATMKNMGLNPDVIGSGKVIGTYPKAGMRVFTGRKIEIYCFNFNVERFINRLIGTGKDFAKDVLKDLGVNYHFSYLAYSKDIGKVLSIYTKGEDVYLLIDRGERKKYFMITDFRGMEVKKAIKQLKNMNIPYQIIGSGNIVVDQSPPPGTVYDRIILITK